MIRGLCLILAVCVFLPHHCTVAGEPKKTLNIAFCYGPGKKPLGDFAKYLEKNYRVSCVFVEAEKSRDEKETPFENIEALAKCDVIVSNLYRTWARPKQLAILKRYFTTKPVVGMRKAHHGFQNWLSADQEVFGARYRGHYFVDRKKQFVRIVPGREKHPLVMGHKPSMPGGGLYRHEDLANNVTVLLEGGPDAKRMQPQTWFRTGDKHRTFYTRYDPKDLAQPDVRELVTRAVFWSADVEPGAYRK